MSVETQQEQKHLLAESSTSALSALFQRAYREFPSYRDIFDKEKISPSDEPLTVLNRLPVLDAQSYMGLQQDIFQKLKKRHFLTEYTSGTTGRRKVRFTTMQDELAEEELCVRFFQQCGIGPGDRVVALDIDSPDIYLFYGCAMKKVGISNFAYYSVPADFNQSLELALRTGPTVILSVPSLLLRCYPKLQEMASKNYLRELSKIIYIGESMSESFRRTLINELGVEVFSFFGSTEIGSVGGECTEHIGVHLYNDKVIPTIISPIETDTSISGEVVWTTLHFQDQPLIKYATRDSVCLSKIPCKCGQAFPLMESVCRTEEQFVVYGHKFKYEAFHQAIEQQHGPLEFLFVEIGSTGSRDQVKFVLPERFAEYEERIIGTIRNTQDMGYFTGMNFLYCCLEFRSTGSFVQRKCRRVLDRRGSVNQETYKECSSVAQIKSVRRSQLSAGAV